MGMIDDLKSLGWKIKFAGIAAAATIVIFGGDVVIHQIGSYGAIGRVDLGWFSIPFTYLGIIGITNAINLLDGLNGLAGGVSLLGFLFMGIAALIAGNIMLALVCFAFVGALGAYLLFNFPKARVFMGDTGSLFLGFSLSITAVMLTQDANTSVDSMFPVLVLLIPIVDTVRVLVVRVLNGKNPFKADHLHLHFLITQKNISPMNVTLLFWLVTAVFGWIGLSLTHGTSMSYLNVVLFGSLFLSLFAAALTQEQRKVEAGAITPFPVELKAGLTDFSRYSATPPNIFYKGEIMTLKLIVLLGVLLLPTQSFTEQTGDPKAKDPQSGHMTPDAKPKLSKHNQAMVKQAEAAKNKRANIKAKLSKRNQAKIKQAEAAKMKNELIEKPNPDSTEQ
jgi:UDP-N-acetylmuramyl pentapeptide phosphotransferase/UDP-N-acetylglucosamine-1-phosphate transferase